MPEPAHKIGGRTRQDSQVATPDSNPTPGKRTLTEGPKGDKGDQGEKGDKGEPGKDAYSDLKTQLISATTTRMLMAYTDFASACQIVGASIKAKAKADAELFCLFVDIGLGFMLPGLSKALGNLIGRIPLTLSDEARRIMEAAAINLSNQDLAKALIQSATKVGTKQIKDNATALFGDSEVDAFIRALQVQFHGAFQVSIEELKQHSTTTLVALCASFYASVTNLNTYITAVHDLVRRFEKEVEPIHADKQVTYAGNGVSEVHDRVTAYWLFDKNNPAQGSYLGTVREGNVTVGFTSLKSARFLSWVSPDMKAMALAKTQAANARDKPAEPSGPHRRDINEVKLAPPLPNDPKRYVREP